MKRKVFSVRYLQELSESDSKIIFNDITSKLLYLSYIYVFENKQSYSSVFFKMLQKGFSSFVNFLKKNPDRLKTVHI